MARPVNGWDFLEIANPEDGSPVWLGLSRMGARSAVDRKKIWTLIPSSRMFVANWFVTEDDLRRDDQIWDHQNIDITEARDLLLTIPQPTWRTSNGGGPDARSARQAPRAQGDG